VEVDNLAGRRKAAALLIALGPELSALVLKHLRDDETEDLIHEVVQMQRVPSEVRDAILQQAYEEAMTRQYIQSGGVEYARDLLSRALGTQKATEMLSRSASGGTRDQPFDFIRQADPGQLITFLENEHPQTIALVLSHLPHELAGRILAGLEFELQADVSSRIAQMQRTAPEVTREVENVLKKRLATVNTQGYRVAGGVEYLVRILGAVDTRTERGILEGIEHNDPELAAEIRRRMFTFDDIVTLDDKSIQRVLQDVNEKDLTMALRIASDEVKNKIFKNMSARRATMLQENMSVQGPVRLRLAEEAQQRIINVIRTLQESEEIIISRGREDVFV
jgi:flagellar motor switch protein FliG